MIMQKIILRIKDLCNNIIGRSSTEFCQPENTTLPFQQSGQQPLLFLRFFPFYISIKAFLHFWLPYTLALMFIMISCNLSIWRKFRRGRTFPMQQNRGPQNQRLVKTLLLISLLALLSWIPLIIMNTLSFFNCSINRSVYNWASFLNFSNSSVNPLVYALRIPEFMQKGLRLNVLLQKKRLALKSVTAKERRENKKKEEEKTRRKKKRKQVY